MNEYKRVLGKLNEIGIDLDKPVDPLEEVYRPRKEFTDAEIKKVRCKALVIKPDLSDATIKTAVNAIYALQNQIGAIDNIVDILFSLIYHETRLPHDLSKRLFVEYKHILDQEEIQMQESGYILQLDLFAQEQTGEVENVEYIDEDDAEQYNFIREGLAAADISELPFKPSEMDLSLSLEDRAYIGAWAFYHTRCITFHAKKLLRSLSSHNFGFKEVVQEVYGIETKLNLPPFSEQLYNVLDVRQLSFDIFQKKAFCVRAICLANHFANSKVPEHKQIELMMRKLSVDFIFGHGLITYGLAQTAKKIAGLPMLVLLDSLDTVLTEKSIANLKLFLYRYVFNQEYFDALPKEQRLEVGRVEKSKYYRIARIISTDYFRELGKKGENETLVAALVTFCQRMTGGKALQSYVLEQSEYTEWGEKLGFGLANFLQSDYNKVWQLIHSE